MFPAALTPLAGKFFGKEGQEVMTIMTADFFLVVHSFWVKDGTGRLDSWQAGLACHFYAQRVGYVAEGISNLMHECHL